MRQKIYAYIEDEFSIFHDFMWKWSSMLNYLWAAMIVIGIVYSCHIAGKSAVYNSDYNHCRPQII